MSWRRKHPGLQQPWYLLYWTGTIQSPHVKGYGRYIDPGRLYSQITNLAQSNPLIKTVTSEMYGQ